MKFLKVMCLIIFVLFGSTCFVKANPAEELRSNIVEAQERFEQARKALKSKNPKMFYDFESNKWTEDCYIAEEVFKKYYPKEYQEYIISRTNLDDLFYTFFVNQVNQINNASSVSSI